MHRDKIPVDTSILNGGNSGDEDIGGTPSLRSRRTIAAVEFDDSGESGINERAGEFLNVSSDVRTLVLGYDEVAQVGVSIGSEVVAYDTASSNDSWASRGMSLSLRNAETTVEVESADESCAGSGKATSLHSWSSSTTSRMFTVDRSDFSHRDGDLPDGGDGMTAQDEEDFKSDDNDLTDTTVQMEERKGVSMIASLPVVALDDSMRSTERDVCSIGEREDDMSRCHSDLRSWVGKDDEVVLHGVSARTGLVAHDTASSNCSWSSRGASQSVRKVEAFLDVANDDEGYDRNRVPPSRHSWQSSTTSTTSAAGRSVLSHGDGDSFEGDDVLRDKHRDHLAMHRDNIPADTSIHDGSNLGDDDVGGTSSVRNCRTIAAVEVDGSGESGICEGAGECLNMSSDVRTLVLDDNEVALVGVSIGSEVVASDTANSNHSWASRGISLSVRKAEPTLEVESADEGCAGSGKATSLHSWSSSTTSRMFTVDRSDFFHRDGDLHDGGDGITAQDEENFNSDDNDLTDTKVQMEERNGVNVVASLPVVALDDSMRSTERDVCSIGEREDDMSRCHSDLRSWVGEDDDAVLVSASARSGSFPHGTTSSFRSWSSRGASQSDRKVEFLLEVENGDEGYDINRVPSSRHSWRSSTSSGRSDAGRSVFPLGVVGAEDGDVVVRGMHGDFLALQRDNALEDSSSHLRGNSGVQDVRGRFVDRSVRHLSSLDDADGEAFVMSSDVKSVVDDKDEVAVIGVLSHAHASPIGVPVVGISHAAVNIKSAVSSTYGEGHYAVELRNLNGGDSVSNVECLSLKSWDGNASRDTWTNGSFDYDGTFSNRSWASRESGVIRGSEEYGVIKASVAESALVKSKTSETPIDARTRESGISSYGRELLHGEGTS
jgi:hypothetical protein